MPDQAISRAPSLTASIVDLSRTRQALLSVAQPALGALLALGRLPSPIQMALGMVAATAGYLAVFSLNDVLDRRADEHALEAGKGEFSGFDLDTAFVRHPLARGDLSLRASLVWVGGLGLVSAVCAWELAPVCLALFAGAVVLEAAYCALRSVTWTKTIVSGLMVGVGGLAGWAAVAPLSTGAVSFFAFLVLWEIGGRNLPNDLADVASDRAVGLQTVAAVFGPRVSARATLCVAALAVLALAALPQPLAATVLALCAGAWALLAPAVRLVRTPTSEEAGRYFNRASLLPALVLATAFVGVAVGR